ncbi:hypothetical protein HNP69_000523 [Chryseobacterium koreense]|nr:hypothetical protein [Chryseobacterium koreense]
MNGKKIASMASKSLFPDKFSMTKNTSQIRFLIL